MWECRPASAVCLSVGLGEGGRFLKREAVPQASFAVSSPPREAKGCPVNDQGIAPRCGDIFASW